MKKEKRIHDCFAVAPQIAKLTVTVGGKCLVKMEQTLNLFNKVFWERILCMITYIIYIIFIIVYCYIYSFSLLVVINLFLCLIYKLNFITGMYGKTQSMQGSVLSAVSGILWRFWDISPVDKDGGVCVWGGRLLYFQLMDSNFWYSHLLFSLIFHFSIF